MEKNVVKGNFFKSVLGNIDVHAQTWMAQGPCTTTMH